MLYSILSLFIRFLFSSCRDKMLLLLLLKYRTVYKAWNYIAPINRTIKLRVKHTEQAIEIEQGAIIINHTIYHHGIVIKEQSDLKCFSATKPNSRAGKHKLILYVKNLKPLVQTLNSSSYSYSPVNIVSNFIFT
jgi:hypothetical protein